MKGKLALYLRVDDYYSELRASEIRGYINCHSGIYQNRIMYNDHKLSAKALEIELNYADVFVLPFKLTVSDVPLVIIEAAMSGKPLITLDTPGVTEWRDIFTNILISDQKKLSATMQVAATLAPKKHNKNIHQWANWKKATEQLSLAINEPLDCGSLDQYRMICLVGIDGCGKTTLLNRLSEQIGLQNRPHNYVWSRFRNYFSKPFLGFLRITGHNRKVVINGVRIGLHDFTGSRLVSNIFLCLQRWDMWLDIHYRYKPRLKQGLILSDRCPLDTLIDLAIDTGMEEKILGDYGRKIYDQLPSPSIIIMVTRGVDDILNDRPDIASDPHHDRRITLYKKMAAELDIPILKNDGSIEEGLDRICQIAGSFLK